MAVKRTMYQRKVDVDMLNAVKRMLADILSISSSSEQRAVAIIHCTYIIFEHRLSRNLELGYVSENSTT